MTVGALVKHMILLSGRSLGDFKDQGVQLLKHEVTFTVSDRPQVDEDPWQDSEGLDSTPLIEIANVWVSACITGLLVDLTRVYTFWFGREASACTDHSHFRKLQNHRLSL